MSAASLATFRRTITVKWDGLIQLEGKKLLLKTARRGHASILADAERLGIYPAWEAYANRPGNTNLESVILPGPIVYRYRYLSDVAEAALRALQKRSPVRSGLYAKSHTIFFNGAAVARPPRTFGRGDQIIIANPVPYARRLEIGKTESGRDFLVSVPNRIYETVAKRDLSKYKNMAKITFGYANIPGGYQVKGKLPSHYVNKHGVRRKRNQVVGARVQSPAIFIEPF